MNPLEILKNLNEFNKSLLLMEERYQNQGRRNDEIKDGLASLRQQINELTIRVAVLEANDKSIEDRVARKMTEVIASWERQSHEQERVRMQEELAKLRREIPSKNE